MDKKMDRKILTAGNKRTHTFWNNDMSLTSKHILVINGGVYISDTSYWVHHTSRPQYLYFSKYFANI